MGKKNIKRKKSSNKNKGKNINNSTKKKNTGYNTNKKVSQNINNKKSKNNNSKKSIPVKKEEIKKTDKYISNSKIFLNILGILVIVLFLILLIIINQKPKNNFFNYISSFSDNVRINSVKKIKKRTKKIYTKETIKEIEPKATAIPIFTFHRIVPDNVKHEKYEKDEWVASADIFDNQLKYLYDNGYKTISLDQFYCWYKKKCEFAKKTVVITFDDGNYDDYYVVLPILKKYNFKATTFIVGSRTAKKDDGKYDPYTRKFITKKMIKTVKKSYPYWDIQSHTYDMHVVEDNGKERVLNLSEKEIKEDYIKNKEFGFKYIAYPFGVYNDAMKRQAKENNYNLAFIFRKHRLATRDDDPYEIPRIKINGFSNVDDIKKWLD